MTTIPSTAIEAAAAEIAGKPRCGCPDDWRQDSPESRIRCPAHGSAPWPEDRHRNKARRILEASGLPADLQAAQERAERAEAILALSNHNHDAVGVYPGCPACEREYSASIECDAAQERARVAEAEIERFREREDHFAQVLAVADGEIEAGR